MCYMFAGDPQKALSLADEYSKSLKCDSGKALNLWAMRHHAPSNTEIVDSYDPETGVILINHLLINPPTAERDIIFDCAISEGCCPSKCRWIGANYSYDTLPRACVRYWYDCASFSTHCDSRDTAVVCVSCPR